METTGPNLDSLAGIDPDELRRAIKAEQSRRSLAEFVRHGWGVLEPGVELEWNWHIPFLCDHIQAVLEDWIRKQEDPSYEQRCRNLLVNVPPGTAKSRITSVFAPAWMWLRWPSWRVLCLSANPDVALRDGDLSRQLIESEWYRDWFGVEWKLREDQDAKSNYGNTAKGQRVSKGIRSKIVGVRFDAIIVDDPNDMKEVHSEAIRRSVNYSWDHGIANRVNDLRSSVRIGIMQRGHEDDWSGHILRKGGVEHICLPMEYEHERAHTTFLGRRDPRTKPGEVLHPARFTAEVLAEERRKGSYYVAGQLQQRPAPAEGGMFKRGWWRFCKLDGIGGDRPRPSGCSDEPAITVPVDKHGDLALEWLTITMDAAFKKTEDGSRVSIQVVGGKGTRRFLLDNVTRPMTFPESVEALRAMCKKWPKAQRKLVENKANGPAIVQTLKGKISGLIEVEPEGGKEARAAACSPEVEAGDVYLLDGAAWLEDFVEELSVFPNGAKDDQVDSLSQALIYHGGQLQGAARARALAS